MYLKQATNLKSLTISSNIEALIDTGQWEPDLRVSWAGPVLRWVPMGYYGLSMEKEDGQNPIWIEFYD